MEVEVIMQEEAETKPAAKSEEGNKDANRDSSKKPSEKSSSSSSSKRKAESSSSSRSRGDSRSSTRDKRSRRDVQPEIRAPSCRRVYVANIPYDIKWQDLKDLVREKVKDCEFVHLFDDENGKPRGCGLVEFKDPASARKAIDVLDKLEFKGRKLVVKEDHDTERDHTGRIVREGSRRTGQNNGSQGSGYSSRGGHGGGGRPSDRYDGGYGGGGSEGRGGGGGGDGNGNTESNKWGNTYGLSPQFLESLGIVGPIINRLFVANLDYQVSQRKLREIFSLAGHVVSVNLNTDKSGNSKGHGVIVMDHPVEAVQAISMFHGQTLMDRAMTVKMDRYSDDDDVSFAKLPSGLKSVGMGLGVGGQPLMSFTGLASGNPTNDLGADRPSMNWGNSGGDFGMGGGGLFDRGGSSGAGGGGSVGGGYSDRGAYSERGAGSMGGCYDKGGSLGNGGYSDRGSNVGGGLGLGIVSPGGIGNSGFSDRLGGSSGFGDRGYSMGGNFSDRGGGNLSGGGGYNDRGSGGLDGGFGDRAGSLGMDRGSSMGGGGGGGGNYIDRGNSVASIGGGGGGYSERGSSVGLSTYQDRGAGSIQRGGTGVGGGGGGSGVGGFNDRAGNMGGVGFSDHSGGFGDRGGGVGGNMMTSGSTLGNNYTSSMAMGGGGGLDGGRLDDRRDYGGRRPFSPAQVENDYRTYGEDQSGRYGGGGGGVGATIYVRNLPYNFTRLDLLERFCEAGKIEFAKMSADGIGLVCFSTERDALRAIHMFDGVRLDGRVIEVSPH